MKLQNASRITSVETIRDIVGHELKTGKEGLRQWSWALRLLEGAGIERFTWDYSKFWEDTGCGSIGCALGWEDTGCGSIGCALGWGATVWPNTFIVFAVDIAVTAEHFGCNTEDIDKATALLGGGYQTPGAASVRPHHVADELDRIAEEL